MALVPHKVVALNELNEGEKNTISGAVVSLFDTEGNAVTLFDDESGANGSTAKQTDSEGVVVVYVTPGEYDEQVNGGIQRRVLVGNKEITTEQLIERIRKARDGDVVTTTGFYTAGDADGAQWKATATTGLTPSQTPVERGAAELVDGSGRLWELVYPSSVDALGASGDGVSDDTPFWVAYLATFGGLECYGSPGKIYGINSTLELPSVCVLRDASFVDINPTVNSRVLHSSSNTSIRLNRVNVDRGGINNSGSMSDSAGIWISGGSVKMSNVEVTGDGFGNGVALDNPISASLFKVRVYESRVGDSSTTPVITDDVFQGIWVNRGVDVSLLECKVEDTVVEWSGQAPTTQYNRGFSIGGTKRFTLTSCTARSVGQAFDFSGDQNSTQFTVTGCFAVDAYSWGFKAANTTTKGKYIGCHAVRCDLGGFVASAPSQSLANPLGEITQDIEYIGCEAIDTGSVGNWAGVATVASYRVMNSVDYPSYPRGVKWINCKAYNGGFSQYGFFNDVTVLESNTSWNEAINCESYEAKTEEFTGMNNGFIERAASTNQPIPNNSITKLNFGSTITDGFNGATNANDVTIRRRGTYNIDSSYEIAGNASGVRSIFIYVNGSTFYRKTLPPNASATSVDITKTLELEAGDVIDVRAYQDSGGALDVQSGQTRLTVSQVR